MQQQIKNPEVSPGFEGGVEVIQNPQTNLEAKLFDCQENYSSIHLLADMLDKHLALRNELAVLRAENARLRLIAGGAA